MKQEGTQEQGHDRTDVREGVRKQVRMESGTRQRDGTREEGGGGAAVEGGKSSMDGQKCGSCENSKEKCVTIKKKYIKNKKREGQDGICSCRSQRRRHSCQ